MKIVINEVDSIEESSIIINTKEKDEFILSLITFIEIHNKKITGFIDKDIFILEPKLIYYIESIDNRTFIYYKDQVYQTRQPLYQLESELGNTFFRSSKSMIINIDKIQSIRPLFDSRYEATLKNDEKVYISRNYIQDLKKRLGL